jgi:hypothetical protein
MKPAIATRPSIATLNRNIINDGDMNAKENGMEGSENIAELPR